MYAPVGACEKICSVLTLALVKKRHTRQIEFVMAYPQAPLECELYMELPSMVKLEGNEHNHVLRLKRNLYGSTQAGKVWYNNLK